MEAIADVERKIASANAKGNLKGKIEVAINLHKSGFSIEIISQNTGLSIDEVKNIVENKGSWKR